MNNSILGTVDLPKSMNDSHLLSVTQKSKLKKPYNQKTKEQKALETWKYHIKEWEEFSEKLAKKFNKPKSELIMLRADNYQRQVERQRLLERQIPTQNLLGNDYWTACLRNESTRWVHVGNQFSGLYCRITHPKEEVQIIRKPMLRNENATEIKRRTKEDVKKEQKRDPAYSYPVEGDNLFVKAVDLFDWSKCSTDLFYKKILEEEHEDDLQRLEKEDCARFGPPSDESTLLDINQPTLLWSLSLEATCERSSSESSPPRSKSPPNHLDFLTSARVPSKKKIKVTNTSMTAIEYRWIKLKKTMDLLITKDVPTEEFSLLNTYGVILPDETIEFYFNFFSLNWGFFQEDWKFLTFPKIQEEPLILSLWGVASQEDESYFERKSFEHNLEKGVTSTFICTILDGVINNLPDNMVKNEPVKEINKIEEKQKKLYQQAIEVIERKKQLLGTEEEEETADNSSKVGADGNVANEEDKWKEESALLEWLKKGDEAILLIEKDEEERMKAARKTDDENDEKVDEEEEEEEEEELEEDSEEEVKREDKVVQEEPKHSVGRLEQRYYIEKSLAFIKTKNYLEEFLRDSIRSYIPELPILYDICLFEKELGKSSSSSIYERLHGVLGSTIDEAVQLAMEKKWSLWKQNILSKRCNFSSKLMLDDVVLSSANQEIGISRCFTLVVDMDISEYIKKVKNKENKTLEWNLKNGKVPPQIYYIKELLSQLWRSNKAATVFLPFKFSFFENSNSDGNIADDSKDGNGSSTERSNKDDAARDPLIVLNTITQIFKFYLKHKVFVINGEENEEEFVPKEGALYLAECNDSQNENETEEETSVSTTSVTSRLSRYESFIHNRSIASNSIILVDDLQNMTLNYSQLLPGPRISALVKKWTSLLCNNNPQDKRFRAVLGGSNFVLKLPLFNHLLDTMKTIFVIGELATYFAQYFYRKASNNSGNKTRYKPYPLGISDEVIYELLRKAAVNQVDLIYPCDYVTGTRRAKQRDIIPANFGDEENDEEEEEEDDDDEEEDEEEEDEEEEDDENEEENEKKKKNENKCKKKNSNIRYL